MSLNEQDHQNESDDHDHEDEEATLDAVVVTSTRSGRMAQDNPMRVELINQEEIEEKAIMRPGNIATLVNETGGVRVQVTSPGLGAANVRIQGLYGRYTQILADGLPLYGGQSLGVLQIPPTDLGRVEVIKGSASSLYGASALGGVINLISRRPGDEANGEVLFNLTSRDGQDLTAYGETPINDELAVSLTAGAHRQSLEDFDQDGWIDLPAYERFTARPRLFWEDSEGNSIYATLGFMTEEREGGTRDGRTVPDGTYFPLTQDSTRIDGGVIARTEFSPDISGQIRASAMVQDHDHVYGDVAETDKHENYLLEASLTGQQSNWDWVLGLAYQSDSYSSETYPDFDFSYDVPGLFGQVDYDFTQDLSLSVSGRVDDHSEYGTQFSPRVSLLYRPGDWTIRGSVAEGFFAPTPFVEEIEASGLSRLLLLEDLEEETARTASLDVGYRRGPFEGNVTVFASDVENATILEEVSSTTNGPADRVRLVNLDGTTRIRGSELVLRYVWNDFKLTAAISTPIQASLLLTACPVTKSRSPHNTRQVWSLCGNAMVNSDWALKCTTLASSA
tara:strand:- start:59122 stop:60810 length:1689 start_codon:yes stop_codon:yes gene_type:complete